jgi:hypothetical protein
MKRRIEKVFCVKQWKFFLSYIRPLFWPGSIFHFVFQHVSIFSHTSIKAFYSLYSIPSHTHIYTLTHLQTHRYTQIHTDTHRYTYSHSHTQHYCTAFSLCIVNIYDIKIFFLMHENEKSYFQCLFFCLSVWTRLTT